MALEMVVTEGLELVLVVALVVAVVVAAVISAFDFFLGFSKFSLLLATG